MVEVEFVLSELLKVKETAAEKENNEEEGEEGSGSDEDCVAQPGSPVLRKRRTRSVSTHHYKAYSSMSWIK